MKYIVKAFWAVVIWIACFLWHLDIDRANREFKEEINSY